MNLNQLVGSIVVGGSVLASYPATSEQLIHGAKVNDGLVTRTVEYILKHPDRKILPEVSERFAERYPQIRSNGRDSILCRYGGNKFKMGLQLYAITSSGRRYFRLQTTYPSSSSLTGMVAEEVSKRYIPNLSRPRDPPILAGSSMACLYVASTFRSGVLKALVGKSVPYQDRLAQILFATGKQNKKGHHVVLETYLLPTKNNARLEGISEAPLVSISAFVPREKIDKWFDANVRRSLVVVKSHKYAQRKAQIVTLFPKEDEGRLWAYENLVDPTTQVFLKEFIQSTPTKQGIFTKHK